MVCRQTNEHRVFALDNRDRETIHNLIYENCKNLSVIHKDDWRGYVGLKRIPGETYTHLRYLHTPDGYRPQNSKGTNQIESLWS